MEERRKVANLLRFVGLCVAFPALSIAFAFWVFEGFDDHWLHIAGLTPVGIAGVAVAAVAPRLAARWVPDRDGSSS